MAQVRLREVVKTYGEVVAVDHVSLTVEDGEFVALVGPSGCGKTTTLNLVAGLLELSDGEIWLGDRLVNDLDPKDRDVAMVFQNYALYPNKTVYNNLAFPLRMRRTPRATIDGKVRAAARLLGIEHLLERRPRELSGGQQQRVALGWALVRDPLVFLMDEPLSNLDAKLRVQMRAELKRFHQDLAATVIYVTHDQLEAMTMADRMAVMSNGVLQQYDTPERLFASPVNTFVAGFVGSPAMNLVPGRVVADGSTVAIVGEDGWRLELSPDNARKALAAGPDGVVLGTRHSAIRVRGEAAPGAIPGRVYTLEPTGDVTYVHVELGKAATLIVSVPPGVAELVHKAKPLLIGRDPTDIGRLVEIMIRCLSGEGSQAGATVTAISGIEIALWDLLGRRLRTPISTFFGGRFRDRIRVYADCHAGETPDPADWARKAREIVAEGFTALKFDLDAENPHTRDISDDPHPRRRWYEPFNRTIGWRELKWQVDCVRAVREAVGPEIMVAMDAHWKYSVDDAIRLAQALEPFDLLWLEDPVPPRTSRRSATSPTAPARRSARVRTSIASTGSAS